MAAVGVNMSAPRRPRSTSGDLSDFLLSFVFANGIGIGAVCENTEVTAKSKTAVV